MQPDKATRLQEAVMKGCYDEAVQLLPQLIQEPHSLKQVGRNTTAPAPRNIR
jgi:hypothetical protein